jgi:Cys-tRNA(Pro) deacylase
MEIILDKDPVKRVRDILAKFDSNIKVTTLNTSAKTAKDAANSLNCKIGAIVKSLLLKVEDNFLICLVAGDKRCSLNKLKNILKKDNISMASAPEVKKRTGFSIGGVSPVGHINTLNVLVDNSLNRFTTIFAAGGHSNCIFKINYKDLIKITNGIEENISE